MGLAFRINIGKHELGIAQNYSQRCIDLMGDSCSKLAQGLHFLGLTELLFQLAVGRYIPDDFNDAIQCAVGIGNRNRPDFKFPVIPLR